MSAIERKENNQNFHGFNTQPVVFQRGFSDRAAGPHIPDLQSAIKAMLADGRVQVVSGPLIAKTMRYVRPTLLKNVKVAEIRSTESLFLQDCELGTVQSNRDIILIRTSTQSIKTGRTLYCYDSTASNLELKDIDFSCSSNPDSMAMKLTGLMFENIVSSYPQVQLIQTIITGTVHFQKEGDPAFRGILTLKGRAAIGKPEQVNGQIISDAEAEAFTKVVVADQQAAAAAAAEQQALAERAQAAAQQQAAAERAAAEQQAAAERAEAVAQHARAEAAQQAAADALANTQTSSCWSNARVIALLALATGVAVWNYCP